MSEQKPEEKNEAGSPRGTRNINTGGGTYVEGNVSTGGGDFVGHDKNVSYGAKADEIAAAFSTLYRGIEEKVPDPTDRADAVDTVKKLESEAHKGDQADENRVERWFNFLADISPDVLEVAAATFVNPIAGVSKVFQKIAEKVKEGRKE